MGCDDFLAGMLLAGVLKILDSSDARPDLCLGIAGCWGSLYWLLRGVCCLVVRECFCWSWGIRWESLKKG